MFKVAGPGYKIYVKAQFHNFYFKILRKKKDPAFLRVSDPDPTNLTRIRDSCNVAGGRVSPGSPGAAAPPSP